MSVYNHQGELIRHTAAILLSENGLHMSQQPPHNKLNCDRHMCNPVRPGHTAQNEEAWFKFKLAPEIC